MKKNSNLLILALLTIGMGLTSCDEMLDNAVDPGVMPDVEVTSITLSETSLKIQVDESYALTATVEPADADYTLTWSSSDETIATVDENGLIHSVAEGNVIITAQAGNMKATCDVLVKDEYTADNQYKEATWDATNSKVVFKKKSVESVAVITNSSTASSITSGWYSVTDDNVIINGDITLSDDLYLILCDGAKLTINGNIDGSSNKYNLYIYGQANQTGQLVVNCSSGSAIAKITTLEVHSCQVTATSSSSGGFTSIKTFNVLGGSVYAECTGTNGFGIILASGGSMNIYGGEVKAVGKGTNSLVSYGIAGSATVTVYGGKLWAENADNKAIDFNSITLTKDAGYTSGKIEYSSDKSTWSETADASAKYVRVGY